METKTKLSFEDFMASLEKIKKNGGVDLSAAEDLSLAVMNLVSLEEHFFFTALKTKKDSYLDMAGEIRQMRKQLLAELMPEHEGETWCASKHLLAATMRLIEVGNKYHAEGEKEKAGATFARAYRVYAIFWALKLKLVEAKKKTGAQEKNSKLEDLVAQLADCCNE